MDKIKSSIAEFTKTARDMIESLYTDRFTVTKNIDVEREDYTGEKAGLVRGTKIDETLYNLPCRISFPTSKTIVVEQTYDLSTIQLRPKLFCAPEHILPTGHTITVRRNVESGRHEDYVGRIGDTLLYPTHQEVTITTIKRA